jgi:hypothetical protein
VANILQKKSRQILQHVPPQPVGVVPGKVMAAFAVADDAPKNLWQFSPYAP